MNNVLKYTLAVLIGSLVGFIGGFQGIAGGFYISALLIMLGIANTQRKAAGTTLLAILFPISFGAVFEYWKSGDIDVVVALIITLFYIIFATLGAKVNKQFEEHISLFSLAILLALTSIYFAYKGYMKLYKK
jgi:uncharacterized membrane protein YfcA